MAEDGGMLGRLSCLLGKVLVKMAEDGGMLGRPSCEKALLHVAGLLLDGCRFWCHEVLLQALVAQDGVKEPILFSVCDACRGETGNKVAW